jgi:hypothetical protein
MNKILEENLKPRTVITYMLFFSFLYLCVKALPIPDLLTNLIFVMQGYWFGSRNVTQPKGDLTK